MLFIPAALIACSSTDQNPTPGGATTPVTPPATAPIVADLRGDSNRDGVVNVDDDSDKNKTDWNKTTGAILIANIDDDSLRCKVTSGETDVDIAKCNDAQDDIVNGPDDALDIARLKSKPWAAAPDDATASLGITTPSAVTQVRLFKKTGTGDADFTMITAANDSFTADEIRNGIEFGIEARDIVRDPAVWDGYVDVQLTVSTSAGSATDTVHMRVAPVMTYHHLLPGEQVYVSNTGDDANTATRTDLATACKAAGVNPPQEIDDGDQWAQDFFEPAFMTMPGPNGTQHAMRVNYRSANVFAPDNAASPLRPAGQVVFRLRGKDFAGIQQYDITHDQNMDSLNSFGNLETIPPYTLNGQAYPLGRVLRGRVPSLHPDPTFDKMVESQGQQPYVTIDTSWLLVGHVDETTSFVKTATPRGWMLVVNDARAAKQLLEDQVTAGNGAVQMFVGKSWVDDNNKETPAAISITDVLADTVVMQASAEAATEVDGQLTAIKTATGLTDDEIIHIPFLHTTISGASAAYSPGTVNGIYLSATHFGAPDPHGPIIAGKDIFKSALEDPLKKVGVTVDWIEDWDEYHALIGEVHCGSNTMRQIPDVKWWETGR